MTEDDEKAFQWAHSYGIPEFTAGPFCFDLDLRLWTPADLKRVYGRWLPTILGLGLLLMSTGALTNSMRPLGLTAISVVCLKTFR